MVEGHTDQVWDYAGGDQFSKDLVARLEARAEAPIKFNTVRRTMVTER